MMRRTLLLSLLLAAWGALPAQAGPALPPEAAVRQALMDLPSVRAGQGEIAQGEARQRQLEAGPHEWAMTLEGQRRHTRDAGGGPDSRTRDWAVGLERAWRLPGKAALDSQLGQEHRALAEAAAEERLHGGARLLLETWFAWLRARERLVQVEEARASLEKENRAMTRRRELGDASELESLQMEAAFSQMRAEYQTREAELLAARERLQQLFPGLPLPEQVNLPAPQPIAGSLEEWEEALLTQEPALRLARLESSRSRLQAQRADRDRLADPTVGVRVAREKDGEDRLLGLTLTIPLMGSARQAEADRSRAEASIASEREAQVLRETRAAARAAWQQARGAWQAWQASQDAAARMIRAAKLQTRAYELGEGSLAEMLAIRRLAFNAELDSRLAQLDALEKYYRLEIDRHKLWDFSLPNSPEVQP
ncbi:TolC family protein [Azonexus hydrophilus]|jgi:outer membrane protein TolC|uniref:TolC family protein n=1 Tax=Azonexus hydrophilus TaxID=418702 RepID=A0ABZ2XMY3_9RHOO|nr:TolC family protein [Dechloromonas sp.]